LILPHALATQAVELLHAKCLDELLPARARDILVAHSALLEQRRHLLLYFDLDRQAVRVPPGLPQHVIAVHRPVATEQILDRTREDVMDARTTVRRRRALETHPQWRVRG